MRSRWIRADSLYVVSTLVWVGTLYWQKYLSLQWALGFGAALLLARVACAIWHDNPGRFIRTVLHIAVPFATVATLFVTFSGGTREEMMDTWGYIALFCFSAVMVYGIFSRIFSTHASGSDLLFVLSLSVFLIPLVLQGYIHVGHAIGAAVAICFVKVWSKHHSLGLWRFVDLALSVGLPVAAVLILAARWSGSAIRTDILSVLPVISAICMALVGLYTILSGGSSSRRQ
jgi:hypothetical protein